MPAGSFRLRDLWSGATVPLEAGKITLAMAPHSVRLIEFRN
jgi:hypothetical protein